MGITSRFGSQLGGGNSGLSREAYYGTDSMKMVIEI
jgi:hypothetical protein